MQRILISSKVLYRFETRSRDTPGIDVRRRRTRIMNWAHVHLIINHIPVIGILFDFFLLAWAMIRRSEDVKRASLGILVVLALFTPLVFLPEARRRISSTIFQGWILRVSASTTMLHCSRPGAWACLAQSRWPGLRLQKACEASDLVRQPLPDPDICGCRLDTDGGAPGRIRLPEARPRLSRSSRPHQRHSGRILSEGSSTRPWRYRPGRRRYLRPWQGVF